MFRLCFKLRRYRRLPLPRSFSSQSSKNPIEPPNALRNPQTTPPQILPQNAAVSSPSSPSSFAFSTVALSATLLSATIASIAYLSTENEHSASNPILAAMQDIISKSNDSFKRLYDHALQTGVAASILWQSLASVLSSANHEVRAGFELRVAALLADIAAANDARREAIVGAGGGKVVDWLLESVGGSRDGGTQAEAARALAYLIADPNVCKDVFGRPHAVPHLLRFIFSCQPKKKNSRRTSFDVSDSLKGRSMLVAAIMDVVTSNCDSLERTNFKPVLPGNAETRDIAAAIEVVEEGGLHMDGVPDNDEDDNGGKGLKGIGIKILEGKTVLGLTRSSGFMELENSGASGVESLDNVPKTVALLRKRDSLLEKSNLSSAVIPGLWDDLHCQHVAVPFAAWALANWAMASEVNRLHIKELDHDGQVVMTALMAPERSVKWHGSLVARLLLADNNLPLTNSVSDWSSSLLTTISQASKNDDVSLAQVALSAFLLSLERSTDARKVVMEKGLEAMRDAAKRTANYKQIQESMAKVIELLSTGDLHLSLEDSQKWSGILLSWVFGKDSSDIMRSSATMALSSILEDHGPSSVTISQGWLAILLKEVLDSNKTASVKAGTQPKTDKVKTQIDQANVIFATQTVNQLAGAVVSLAANQPGKGDSIVSLADLLSLEPFAGPFKNKKDNSPKLSVADSALSALKGLKALTELCSENPVCQAKITQHGVLCLLRRFLLCDDYEKQAALEAYDASRALEAQERRSNSGDASPDLSSNDPSSVRVPPTAHVRRHAARLLAVLSVLPEVQKIILADETWIKWLDDCANGKIVGCSDLKIQSYARAVLLHVLCNHYAERDAANGNVSGGGVTNKNMCPRYDDMIFLINPELPHWKCYERINNGTAQKDKSSSANVDCAEGNDLTAASVTSESENGSKPGTQVDIVFIHGLRGGPYKTWRIAENKTSTKSGLVEKIDEEAGKMGTFWPAEWLSADFPEARLFTLKYKLASGLDVRLPCGLIAPICIYPFAFGCQTNLTQWSGATLPLQEVSSKLLDKLVDAGIGDRPVVFVTHSMGGLVVKQMLHRARTENIDNLVKNTAGIVFYSCPHFGSRLADMPWRMGLVLRPAPTIGELRSGSPRLEELNDFIRQLHKKGLGVLSFCETKVTPIVEGYGGWAFRMEIVPIESAYPGFGELVVLESTDHINSCKPISRNDPSYTGILEFLRKLKSQFS